MSVSPSDLEIRSRPMSIDREIAAPRWWYSNDPVGTAVMNALSLTFPEGERFFIQSVRRFAGGLPPALATDVRAFTAQEGAHTREHMAFNNLVARCGYDTAPVEALVEERLNLARARPELMQLAATVALEHFTASFAHLLLKDHRLLQDAPTELARLWQWHAIEEIEHKGVAYDVFMHATGHLSPWCRWMIRRWAMGLTTLLFLTTVRRASLMLLKQDGMTGIRARVKLLAWLWGRPGLYRRILGEYFAFYRPAFHPWQVDDRHLIAAAEARLV
jgi:predicted metal-dependent hydrolase